MGNLRKKFSTKPIPPAAEVVTKRGKRVARWVGRHGVTHEALIVTGRDGSDRIRVHVGPWYAKFSRADGGTEERSTGCREKRAAAQLLAQWESEEERIRSGVMSAADLRVAANAASRLSDVVADYAAHLRTASCSPRHERQVVSQLERIAADSNWTALSDVNPRHLVTWLDLRRAEGMSARTRNVYTQAVRGLVRWAVATGRLAMDPLGSVSKADERADRRRERRAFTTKELEALLRAAQERPLHEAQRIYRGPRKGGLGANVAPERLEELRLLGRERALAYRVLALTGLRRGELASLSVSRAILDTERPHFLLAANDDKARRGARIELRADLAEDLREWLRARLARERARASGQVPPLRLDPDSPLLSVPTIRVFNADIKHAAIEKRDDLGRTVDIHALRHTFVSHLSIGGVPLRTGQAAARHSTPVLTANSYTDVALLDVRGALDALPLIPLLPEPDCTQSELRAAVGSEGALRLALQLAPTLALTRTFQPPRHETATSASSVLREGRDPPGDHQVPFSGPSSDAKGGAGEGTRTLDIQLGKLTLYQLSYARVHTTRRPAADRRAPRSAE
jgi:integrase